MVLCPYIFCIFPKLVSEFSTEAPRLVRIFVRWRTLPRKDFSCFWVIGGFKFSIACVFEKMCLMPFSVISYPSQVILSFEK